MLLSKTPIAEIEEFLQDESLQNQTLPVNITKRIEFTINAKLAHIGLSAKEIEEIQNNLGRLAFNMFDASDADEAVTEVSRKSGAAWLFTLRPADDGDCEDFLEPDATPAQRHDAEYIWYKLREAGLVRREDCDSEISFCYELLLNYWCARFCRTQTLNEEFLERTTTDPFREVWPLWAELDERLVTRLTMILNPALGRPEKEKPVRPKGFLGKLLAGKNQPQKAADDYERVELREYAADALGYTRDRRALDALLSGLNDPNYYIRAAAASGLGTLGNDYAIPFLLKRLADPAQFVRRCAALALGEGFSGDYRLIEPLINLLATDKEADVRADAATALASFNDNRAVLDALLRATNDHDEGVRAEVALTLGSFGTLEDNRLARTLVNLLEDSAEWVRQQAARGLGKLASSQGVMALIKALRDESMYVRLDAIEALGKCGDVRAIEPLATLLANPNTGWRDKIIHALDQLGECQNVFYRPAVSDGDLRSFTASQWVK